VFAKIRNIVTHDFLIIIVSDFQRYSPEVVKNIIQLAQHNDVILSKVYDPMEREIPATTLIAGDGDKQLVIDGTNKQIKQNFESGFDADFSKFSSKMKKHRIPIIMVDTVTNVDEQLKETLKGKKR